MPLRWLLPIVALVGASGAWAQTNTPYRPLPAPLPAPQVAPERPSVNLEGMSVEDATLFLLLTIAEDAEDDMRSMLTAMDEQNRRHAAARAHMQSMRQQRESLQAQRYRDRVTATPSVTIAPDVQTQPPAVTAPALDPCTGATAAEWNTCAERIRARLRDAQMPAASRLRVERALSELTLRLGRGGADDPEQPQFARSQTAATNALAAIQTLKPQ